MVLEEDIDVEVTQNAIVFWDLGLIGRFRGFWSTLKDMNKWD